MPDGTSLTRTGFAIRSQMIWAKERLVIGRGDYQGRHEPCSYAVRSKGNWTGDRKQTTLWEIGSGNQNAETVHGTQKPVECMRRPILNNSIPGDAVYEPFLGSGTTLIAAESTGRLCLAMELDPLYVDVAIRRWQAFTGKEAILSGSARTFAQVAEQRGAQRSREHAGKIDHADALQRQHGFSHGAFLLYSRPDRPVRRFCAAQAIR